MKFYLLTLLVILSIYSLDARVKSRSKKSVLVRPLDSK
jgi:hypothetical protein